MEISRKLREVRILPDELIYIMTLKAKPVAPQRRRTTGQFSCGYLSVAEIVVELEKVGASLEDTEIETEYEYCPIVTYTLYESDEEFEFRLEKYRKDLAAYEKWREENKEEIEAEKKRRKDKKIAKLKKEIKKLEDS